MSDAAVADATDLEDFPTLIPDDQGDVDVFLSARDTGPEEPIVMYFFDAMEDEIAPSRDYEQYYFFRPI